MLVQLLVPIMKLKMDNFLSDNWIYFVNIEKENLEEELRKNDKLIADTDNKEEKNNLRNFVRYAKSFNKVCQKQ